MTQQSESERLLDSGSAPVENYGSATVSNDVEGQEEPSRSYIGIVAPMAIGIFLSAMDGTIVLSSYAAIGSELNKLQSASWISTAYLLTITSFQPLYGKLSDIFGRKACLLFAYVVFAIGCLLCGLSRTMNELIASRALAGIGGGGMSTVVSIVVSDVVPLRSRGTWQGILNIIFTFGTATGASLGGIFADTIGWRWSFLCQVPVAFLAIAAVSYSLHLPKQDSGNFKEKIQRVDGLGALTLIVSISLLLTGMDRGGNIGWNDPVARYSLLAFAVFASLLLFIEFEWAREPFAPKRIIVNRALIASYLANFLAVAGAMILVFHVPLYFQAVLTKTASQTSLPIIASGLCATIASLGGGVIMQRTGKYYWLTFMAAVTLLVGSLAITLGVSVPEFAELTITVGLMVALTGNGALITTSLISVIANAGNEDQAIATAVSYLFRSLGSVSGVAVGSTVLQTTLKSNLRTRLVNGDIDEIVRRVRESLSYLDQLDESTRAIVRQSYGLSIQSTFWLSTVIAALCILASAYIIEKPLPSRK